MLNSHLIDQMDVSQSYPPPSEDQQPDANDIPPQITDDNLDECLRSEKWKHRKAALHFLREQFSSKDSSHSHIEVFSSRMPEILNDKNVTVLDEGMNALVEFLKHANLTKSIFQFLVPFLLNTPLNKKLERKVIETLNLCTQLAPEITYGAFLKRLDPETPQATLQNVAYFLHQVLSSSEINSQSVVKNLVLKLKGIANHPNQKIKRMAIDSIKELAKYILDDYSSIQKSIFSDIKEAYQKELQASFDQPKHPNSSFYIQDQNSMPLHSNTNMQHATSYISGQQQGVTSMQGINDEYYGSNNNYNSSGQNPRGYSSNRENDFHNLTSQITEQSQHQIPTSLKEVASTNKPRVFQKPSLTPHVPEFQLPDKFFEIPNLRTVDEKRDILSGMNNQLQNVAFFSTALPDQVITILSNELEEANVLLYSLVLEILASLFQKATTKLNSNPGQLKILVSLCGNKYNVKPQLNDYIFSIFSSLLTRKYLTPEVHLRFLLEESSSGKTRNAKLAGAEWITSQLVSHVARGYFGDYGKAIKSKSEFKKYIEKYSVDVGKPVEGLNEEVLAFAYYKISQLLDKEKQVKGQKTIKDLLKVLRDQSIAYRENPKRFGTKSDENEVETRYKQKLTNLIGQLEKSSDKEVMVAGELFIKGVAEIVQSFAAIKLKVHKNITKEVLFCMIRVNNLSKRANQQTLDNELTILSLLDNAIVQDSECLILFEQFFNTFGLKNTIDSLFKLHKKTKQSFEGFLRLIIRVLKQKADAKSANYTQDDLEDVLRSVHTGQLPNSVESKALRDVITQILSQNNPNNNISAIQEQDQNASYQEKLELERQKLQRNLDNLPKITNTGVIRNSQSVEVQGALQSRGRIHEGANKSRVFEPLPAIPYHKSIKELSPKHESQHLSLQNLPLQQLAFKDHSETFEDAKMRFIILLEAVKSFDQLKTFVSRLSNSYKLLHKIMNKVAFREVSSHLEVVLSFILNSNVNYEQTFSEFAILVLSILQEPEREKFFVLVLTYFGKADPFPEKTITTFFQNARNPYRCFKFAFGIVSKNFDSSIKLLFALNLLPVFLSALGKIQWSYDNPGFMALAEAMFFVLIIADNVENHGELLPDKKRISQLFSVREKIESALETSIAGRSSEDILMAFHKEIAGNEQIQQMLEKLIARNQAPILQSQPQTHEQSDYYPPLSSRYEIVKREESIVQYNHTQVHDFKQESVTEQRSDYRQLVNYSITPSNPIQRQGIGYESQNQATSMTQNLYQDSVNDQSLARDRFASQLDEYRGRDESAQIQEEPEQDMNQAYNESQQGQLTDEYPSRVQINDNRVFQKDVEIQGISQLEEEKQQTDKKPDFRLPIKSNISELSKDDRAGNQSQSQIRKKSPGSIDNRSQTKAADRPSSYKHLRDKHKKRMLSLENRLASGLREHHEGNRSILEAADRDSKYFNTFGDLESNAKDVKKEIKKEGVELPSKQKESFVVRHEDPIPPSQIEPTNIRRSHSAEKKVKAKNEEINIGPWMKVRDSFSEQEYDLDSDIYKTANDTNIKIDPVITSPENPHFTSEQPAVQERIADNLADNRKENLRDDQMKKSGYSSDFEAYPSMNLQPDRDQSSFMKARGDEHFKVEQSKFGPKRLNNMLVSANSYFPSQNDQEPLSKPPITQQSNPFLETTPQLSTAFKSISTQTDLPTNYTESEISKLEEKIIYLSEKNAEIIDQLYQLNARNDELKTENEKLASSFKQKNPILQTSSGETLDGAGFKVDDLFLEGLFSGPVVSRQTYMNQLAAYEDMESNMQEKFIFDIKFYVIDKECIQFLSETQFAGFLNFITKLSVFQSMLGPVGSDNALRLLHKILDQMLKAKTGFEIMKSLLIILEEEIPEFSGEGFSEFESLHIRLLSKCLSKILELSKQKQERDFNSFQVLVYLSKIFAKRPPEQLGPQVRDLELFDEIFRLLKQLSDEVIMLDMLNAKIFVRAFKSSRVNQVFMNYVKGFISNIEDSK